jgi:hypothetical protein
VKIWRPDCEDFDRYTDESVFERVMLDSGYRNKGQGNEDWTEIEQFCLERIFAGVFIVCSSALNQNWIAWGRESCTLD